MWENFAGRGSPQLTIWRMRIACWVPTAANAQTVGVILIAFPLQQWTNAPHCYDIRTFPVLLDLLMADMPLRFISSGWCANSRIVSH